MTFHPRQAPPRDRMERTANRIGWLVALWLAAGVLVLTAIMVSIYVQ